MKKFDVIEDNGGGLALIVYTDDRTLVDYVHTGYEYTGGMNAVVSDALLIMDGADPFAEWDGNEVEEEEQRCFDYWYNSDHENIGWVVIANEETTEDDLIDLRWRE